MGRVREDVSILRMAGKTRETWARLIVLASMIYPERGNLETLHCALEAALKQTRGRVRKRYPAEAVGKSEAGALEWWQSQAMHKRSRRGIRAFGVAKSDGVGAREAREHRE